MKLHKLHILHMPLGTIYHSNAVSGGNKGVSGSGIHLPYSTCCHAGNFSQNSFYLLGLYIKDINPIASNIFCFGGNNFTEVMLRDNTNSKVVVYDGNIFMLMYFL